MITLTLRGATAALLAAALVAGCSRTKPVEQPAPAPAPAAAPAPAPAPAGTPTPTKHDDMADMPGMSMQHEHDTANMQGMAGMDLPVKIPAGAIFTEADVRFMQGMIAHHAQAIYMSRLAASHGASPHLLKFAQKIDQSQQVEIRLMQGWLRSNGQVAPDTSSWRHMMMPGMLTAQQLAQLDAAKGTEFDRLFLTFMIQHHEGALSMVKDLFATPQAAQDIDVSVFANDVHTVQTAEIGLMYKMLDAM